VVLCGSLLGLFLVGCGTVRETLPARSATEQLLLSTAADRAVAELPEQIFQGKAVFLDTTFLECTDKAYVIQCMRAALRRNGARIVDAKDQAELILEAGSGALSLDKRDSLFGLPSLPFPLPFAGETLRLPEMPLWKIVTYRGKAKFLFSAVDPGSGRQVADLPVCHGGSRESYWWVLIIGPIRSSDLPAVTD
jgi:hypothetical protein